MNFYPLLLYYYLFMRSFFYPGRVLLLVVLFCSMLFASEAFAQYCTSGFSTGFNANGCTDDDYIDDFSTSGGVTNINNNNTGCASNPTLTGYSNYTSLIHSGVQNTNVNFAFMLAGQWTEGVKIWVDWNQDTDFLDPGELVYSPAATFPAAAPSGSGSFTIPLGALPGTTRMRVRCVFATTTFTACSSHDYTEVEDYGFTVIAMTPCSGTPTATASANSGTFCGSPVTLSYTGPLENGLSYQWQTAPACSNTFANIPGATNMTYSITSLTGLAQYQLVVTCSNGGASATSSIINISTTCYCITSAPGFNSRDDIGQMKVGTFTNPAVVGALTNNPASSGIYSNYTGLGPIVLVPGNTYPVEVTQIEQFATWYQCYLKVFIDWNHNGLFTDLGDLVYQQLGPGSATAAAFSGSFTVPASAVAGNTRMRLVLSEGVSTTITPCQTYTWGETEDYTVTIPPTAVATSNGPICAGNTINLFGTASSSCPTYSWSGPNSFSSPLQNPTIPSATVLASGDYVLTIINGGVPVAYDTVNVLVGPPSNNNISTAICAGDTIYLGTTAIYGAGVYSHTFQTAAGCDSVVNLTVSLNPLPSPPSVTSPVVYCQGAVPAQLTATGTSLLWYPSATGGIGNATAPTPSTSAVTSATYYVSQDNGTCESQRAAIVVTVNPTPNISSSTFTSPTTCSGTNGTITLNGLFLNTSYSVSYSYNSGSPVTSSLSSNGTGNITITGLQAGSYTNISVSLNSCPSNVAGPITLVNPPTPVIASSSSTNPTTCLGTNGTIILNGLTSSTVYGVNYTDGVTPVGPVSLGANAAGTITITGLNAGIYSNVTVTLNNCTSAAVGSFTLTDPLPPAVPVAGNNGPLCTGNTLNLTASSVTPSVAYTWSGPSTYGSGAQNPSIPNVALSNAGIYSVTATLNNCTSAAAATTVVINPTPVISGTTFLNPTTCGGTNGSITINGLTPGTTYTVNYNLGVAPQPGASATSAAGGSITLSGLGTGTYSNITVALNGCPSAAAGPVTLVNPSAPATPVASSNSPVCVGSTLNLNAFAVPGATYTWSGPSTFSATTQNASIASVQLNNAGVYSVYATVNNCNSVSATTTVVVNPIPASPVAGSNSPICQGSNLDLTTTTVPGASYGWSGPSYGSGVQNPTITGALPAASGVYSVTATVAGCTSPADTVAVTVHPTPALPVVSAISFCQFSIASALTATGQNLLWYIVPSGGAGSATAPTPATISAGPVTWYVSQTINGCEGNRAALNVTIIAKPAAPTATGSIFYCQGEAASALTATGQNLLWYTTPTGGAGSSAAPVPATVITGPTDYYVSQTVNGCESDRTLITVTVGYTPPSPVVTSSVVNYCQFSPNTPAPGTYVTGANLTWYTQAAGGIGTTTAPTVNTSLVSTITYYIASVSGSCESVRIPMEVNVIAKPPIPGVADITYCQFLTAVPLTATGQNLLWYQSLTGGIGSLNAPTPNTSLVNTTIYYVSQIVNGCESDRASITVEVIAKPALPAVTATYVYCQYEPATPLNATGQSMLWYTQPSGGTGSSAIPTPSTTIPGTYHWYVSQTIGGCEGDRAMISVVVNPKPANPVVTSTILYCKGDAAVPLTAAGQNLLWYPDPTGGTGSPFGPTPETDSVGTFYFYVSQTQINCESDRSVIQVVVNPAVDAHIAASQSIFCQFDTISLEDVAVNPLTASYQWNYDGGTVVSGSGKGPIQIQWLTAGTKRVILQVTNLNCVAFDTIMLTVKPSPSAAFQIEPDACIGDTIKVQASFNSLDGDKFNWDFADAVVLSGTGPGYYKLRWPYAGEKWVFLSITKDGCTSLTYRDTITIHQLPNATISSVSNNNICSGDAVTLGTADVKDYTYTWSPARFFELNGVPVTIGSIQTTGYVFLDVADEYGCRSIDSVLITTTPCCDVFLPDAFTPNGDGRNDKFRLIGNGHHQLTVMRIANRWGQTVFESASQDASWDGSFGGIVQPMGTYYYFLKYRCSNNETFEKKGEVMLIR
jgi:gliding motility-associated-like protein